MSDLQKKIAELADSPVPSTRELYIGHYKKGPVSSSLNFYANSLQDADEKFTLFVRRVDGMNMSKVVKLKVTRFAVDLDEEYARLMKKEQSQWGNA